MEEGKESRELLGKVDGLLEEGEKEEIRESVLEDILAKVTGDMDREGMKGKKERIMEGFGRRWMEKGKKGR